MFFYICFLYSDPRNYTTIDIHSRDICTFIDNLCKWRKRAKINEKPRTTLSSRVYKKLISKCWLQKLGTPNDLASRGELYCCTNVCHHMNNHRLSLVYITKDTSLYGYGIFLDEYMVISFLLWLSVCIPFWYEIRNIQEALTASNKHVCNISAKIRRQQHI